MYILFFKQKRGYEFTSGFGGPEICIRDQEKGKSKKQRRGQRETPNPKPCLPYRLPGTTHEHPRAGLLGWGGGAPGTSAAGQCKRQKTKDKGKGK